MFLDTPANSEITEDTITDGRVGIRILGADDFEIKGNIIERMSIAFSPTQAIFAAGPEQIADEGGNDVRDNVANPGGTCPKSR